MNVLNESDLEAVRAWAQRRIDKRERWLRMAPLREAVGGGAKLLITSVVPNIMADPTVQTRRSVIALEKSDTEGAQRMRETEERLEAQLARAKRRTAALRGWLEALA